MVQEIYDLIASLMYLWFDFMEDESACFRLTWTGVVSPRIWLVSSLQRQPTSDRAEARWGGDDVRRGGGGVICAYLAP